MKLMHVITGLRTGGAETMLLKLAMELRTLGADQRIVSLTGFDDLGPELIARGFSVTALGMGSPAGLPSSLLRLHALIREYRPDVAQTWLYHADLVGGLAARLAGGCKVVWGIRHSDLSPEANKRSTLRVAAACARLSRLVPDGILCNSARAVETHAAIGYATARMRVIPNGFETDRFRRETAAAGSWRSRLGIPEGGVLVGWAGRNHPQKSPEDFLRAAAVLSKRCPDAHFAMVGAGIERGQAALDALSDGEALRGKVHLLGPCRDMPGFLSALDIFASSSLGEGFSNALAEAMCCEAPCVATDVGDSAAILGETGLTAPAGDPEVLSRQMEILVRAGADRRSELGRAARGRVISKWSIEAVAHEYQEYYGKLLDGKTGQERIKRGAAPALREAPIGGNMGKGNPLCDDVLSEFRMNPATIAAIESAWRSSGLPRERFRVLDFGCGRGRAVVSLRRLGFDAHGVDVDSIPVQHGRDYLLRTGEAPVDCLAVIGFVGEGMPRSAFDFCFSDQVLEHVSDLGAVAGALARSLRPRGRGLHVFPARWRPIEPHVRMPFFHWLPRHAGLRRAAASFWLALGFDPGWQAAQGLTLSAKAGIYADYTLRKTHYRSPGEIRSAFERYGIKTRIVDEAGWPGKRWLKLNFGSVRLELEKPGSDNSPERAGHPDVATVGVGKA